VNRSVPPPLPWLALVYRAPRIGWHVDITNGIGHIGAGYLGVYSGPFWRPTRRSADALARRLLLRRARADEKPDLHKVRP
jgi:hypothetical protein